MGPGAVITAEIAKVGKVRSADACTRLFMYSNGVSGLQITLTNVSEHLNIDFLVFLVSPLLNCQNLGNLGSKMVIFGPKIGRK